MKRNLLLLLVLAICVSGTAQTKLMHYWSFETGNFGNLTAPVLRTTLPTIKANYSVIDTNKATLSVQALVGTGNKYTYFDNYAGSGDSINVRMGAKGVGGNAFRYRSPSDSDAMVFFMPTKGYKNPKIQFECFHSGSGATRLYYAYSIDSGKTWKTSGLSTVSDSVNSVWARSSVITFTDAAVNNNSKFAFAIYNHGIAGNDRFDNVTMDGVSTAGVNDIKTTPAAEIVTNAKNGNLFVSSNKLIQLVEVYDVFGNRVALQAVNNLSGNINLSSVAHGLYILKVYTAEGIVTRKQII